MADPTGRSGLRLAVLAALQAANVAPTIQSPGDWSLPPAKLPAVQVRPGTERKMPVSVNGETQFNSTATIEVKATVSGATGTEALLALEALDALVEGAVLKDIALRRIVQKFTVESVAEIKSDGKVHFASTSTAFHLEFFDVFDPDVTQTLDRMTLTADLRNVFDPTGTYPNPPFPDAVTPAPRTSGPDGRAEGGFDVDLTT